MTQTRDKNGKFKAAVPWWRDDKRICFFDIETYPTFAGNDAWIVCWAVLGEHDTKVTTGNITKQEVFEGTFDKRIVRDLREELNQYDVIVTYNGIMFDAKMFRTRCWNWKVRPFKLGEKSHIDLYWTVRSFFNLSRSSLAVSTDFMGIDGKTPLDFSYWKKAGLGDAKAMRNLLVHNRGDVEILREQFWQLEPYTKWKKKSF